MPKDFFCHPHVRETVRLSWPLVLTQVGHIITGMVDNIFLGALGPAAASADADLAAAAERDRSEKVRGAARTALQRIKKG